MRWKTTTSKDKAKVIQAKISNPDLSTRDLEEKTGVNYRTTSRIINDDLSQVVSQSETIAKMIDDNNEILNLTWWLLLSKLKAWESVRIEEIIKSRDLALKQNKLVEVVDNSGKEIKVTFEI